MTDGNYYDQANVKLLLGIDQDDIIDDETLDALGESVNRDIDNFLASMVIKVPPDSITNDLKMAANYEVVSLYKAKKQDYDGAKYWEQKFKDLKDSIQTSLTKTAQGSSQFVDRFGS